MFRFNKSQKKWVCSSFTSLNSQQQSEVRVFLFYNTQQLTRVISKRDPLLQQSTTVKSERVPVLNTQQSTTVRSERVPVLQHFRSERVPVLQHSTVNNSQNWEDSSFTTLNSSQWTCSYIFYNNSKLVSVFIFYNSQHQSRVILFLLNNTQQQ
jgi:hypothetical protein